MLRMFSGKYFVSAIVGFVSISIVVRPAAGAESTPIPNFSGLWGRDTLLLEPPESGPGPVARITRKPDGTMNPTGVWIGDHTNPILKPEIAEVVRKRAELSLSGTVVPDMHNSCWPEPPPYVLGVHFGVQILQQRDEVVLVYLLHNTVRHVRMDTSHPKNMTPSWQGHSIGQFEGDTLVVDTVGIKVAPLSTVDTLGTPHSEALHVVERYRLIDGEVAAEAQRKKGTIANLNAYGRGDIDPDTTKRGLQVEITVEDAGVFTTSWLARVTYRPVTGEWPEVVCAENPYFLGTGATIPTADIADF